MAENVTALALQVMGKAAKAAARQLYRLDIASKNRVLNAISTALHEAETEILAATTA